MAARSESAGACVVVAEIAVVALQLAPPFVDVNARIVPGPPSSRYGTTTCPLGRTTGCTPMPAAESAVRSGVPHVAPPSADVLSSSGPPAEGTSHAE